MASFCHRCKAELNLPRGTTSIGASCDRCSADVRVCLNCKFYDRTAYNECKEPQAERVLDKDRRNRCDFFVLKDATSADAVAKDDAAALAKKKLDDLFK
jgi:hypothetical protein